MSRGSGMGRQSRKANMSHPSLNTGGTIAEIEKVCPSLTCKAVIGSSFIDSCVLLEAPPGGKRTVIVRTFIGGCKEIAGGQGYMTDGLSQVN
jgi:hypothetical protein